MTTFETTLPNLLPAVRALPRADKLRLIQFIASELEHEESDSFIKAGAVYPIWTPFDASDAASILMQELEKDGAKP